MHPESATELEIALGLIFALAAGSLAMSGHGLAAALCALTTIALGIHAYSRPV